MEEICLFNYEDGTPKSLYDLLSLVTGLLQDSYKSPLNLLSRDFKTPIKRFQDSYQEISRLLTRDFKTPIKRFQDSYKSPINSYKSPINLLSRDFKTPIKRFQDS